nr:pyridoxal 5'-phosphate synthase glutaminase subunit PdxT [Bifidobacterium catenulatum]
MVVAVEYISKEESSDVAEGAASAQHGVTGILAVQGAFAEHAAMLDRLGAPWKLLRAAEDFDDSIDRVILPGGESTTQGKLLRSTGLFEPIAAHIAAGKPVFGTCAGMILLARRLDNDENVYFGALDAVVRRNAYGRQLGSFVATADFGASDDVNTVSVMPGESVASVVAAASGDAEISDASVVLKDFPLVFIRGPFVAEIGERATVETSVDGNVVGLRQGNILATAFHPELTEDTRVHELFLSL